MSRFLNFALLTDFGYSVLTFTCSMTVQNVRGQLLFCHFKWVQIFICMPKCWEKNPQCLSQGKTRNHTVCFDLSKTPIETKHLTFLTGHDRLNIIFRFLCLQSFSKAFVMGNQKLSVSVRAINEIENSQFFVKTKLESC